MRKLQEKWGVSSQLDVWVILIVFSVTGSAASFLSRPIMSTLGLAGAETSGWLFWPVRIVVVFIAYQIMLVAFGWLFGQHTFFWKMEKKMLRRLGLGFLLKK